MAVVPVRSAQTKPGPGDLWENWDLDLVTCDLDLDLWVEIGAGFAKFGLGGGELQLRRAREGGGRRRSCDLRKFREPERDADGAAAEQ